MIDRNRELNDINKESEVIVAMADEETIEIIENEQVLKPRKSLIEKMEDCEKEMNFLKADNERLQKKVSELETKTCYVDEKGYTAGEREKQVQELVQTLKRKEEEVLILELKMDDLSEKNSQLMEEVKEKKERISDLLLQLNSRDGDIAIFQSREDGLRVEKNDLIDGNDWLRNEVKRLKSLLRKCEIESKQIANSEEAFKQINKELSKELESFKMVKRESHIEEVVNSLLLNTGLFADAPMFNQDGLEEENERLNNRLGEAVQSHKEDCRKLDWTMTQIETHIHQVSSLVNHLREEVLS